MESKTFRLIECEVAGLTYRASQSVLERIAAGDEATLVPEPENTHDRFAVKVCIDGELFVGYIPRTHSMMVSNLIRYGYDVTAIVGIVEPSKPYMVIRLFLPKMKDGSR